MVARRDLLRLLARPDEDIAADIEAKLADALPGGGWRASVTDGVAGLATTAAGAHASIARRVALSVPGVVRVRLAPAGAV